MLISQSGVPAGSGGGVGRGRQLRCISPTPDVDDERGKCPALPWGAPCWAAQEGRGEKPVMCD